MTSVNNFNTNKNGNDIEFSGSFDTFASRDSFDENVEVIQHTSYRKTAICFYNPMKEFSQVFELKIKILKTDLIKFVYEHIDLHADATWLKSELMDTAISYLNDELLDYKYDLEDLGRNYDLDISFVNDIQVISTSGYSQGDYALVIVDLTQLNKAWGTKHKDAKELKETIHHLFWDTPVYATVTINGEEYNYFDYALLAYEWEPARFIDLVSKSFGLQSDEISEELTAIIPTTLSYN